MKIIQITYADNIGTLFALTEEGDIYKGSFADDTDDFLVWVWAEPLPPLPASK